MKILIVDDSGTIRKILGKAAKKVNNNIVLHEADNGEDAIKILRDNSDIKYVFLDTLMPGMSGKEVLKTIRTDDDLKHHNVIIQTAEHKHEELQHMINMRISGYILKPFDTVRLVDTLKKWLA